ncbi:hypothetical protein [Alloalcanivorax xenomutans]|uniref:hypothetical protein n=1 Tax=Alloalcanivorax xenomutans TaxID=1094342 RepID=UPI003BA98E66
MKWTQWGLAFGLMVALGGCAHRQPATLGDGIGNFEPEIKCASQAAPEQKVELEMVDTLMARDRNYAALAQLQKAVQNNVEYWQRYGQLLALTGDLSTSKRVFNIMREECDSGESYHGLGMVALKQGNLDESLANLEKAVRKLPASAAVRNDYGYALLLARDYTAAQRQLRTSLELQNGTGKVRQNLAVAYLLDGNEQGIKDLQEQYHFTDDELNHARGLAFQIAEIDYE